MNNDKQIIGYLNIPCLINLDDGIIKLSLPKELKIVSNENGNDNLTLSFE